MTTNVVNIKSTRDFDVFIGRPSKWGNCFVIGKDGNRAAVIAKYIGWFPSQLKLVNDLWQLRGKVIACFCAPESCHGDWLSQIANAEQRPNYGMQRIWDPFTAPDSELREGEIEFLFDNGDVCIGRRRRARLKSGQFMFDQPACPPIVDDDWAVAWRKVKV